MAAFAKPARDGLILAVRLTPNAARDEITGPDRRNGAEPALMVRVKAAPEKGKANKALCALLAEYLALPKSAIEVISGHTARVKKVLIRGDGRALNRLVGAKLSQAGS